MVMVILSQDTGQTWDIEYQVRVWDATGWAQFGLSSPDRHPRSHDRIGFGGLPLITLMDGDLFASWWCTDAS